MEQGHPERFFQLDNLAAHGGLLYPVGHIAHPLTDATILGHIIEKLQVMDVHISNGSMMAAVLSIQQKELKSIICRPVAKGNEINSSPCLTRLRAWEWVGWGMHWVAGGTIRAGQRPGPDEFAMGRGGAPRKGDLPTDRGLDKNVRDGRSGDHPKNERLSLKPLLKDRSCRLALPAKGSTQQ